jgi:fumarate reductase subunit C
MADSAGTATIIGASIAAVVALVGLVASKEQKTSEFRQTWIDELRNDLAIYLSRINAAYDAKAASYPTGAELWTVVREDMTSMNDASNRIRLRLNHKEKPSQDMLKTINEIDRLFIPGDQAEKPHEIDVLQKRLVTEAREVLKTEWNRVKRGEGFFLVTKWTAFVAVLFCVVLLFRMTFPNAFDYIRHIRLT